MLTKKKYGDFNLKFILNSHLINTIDEEFELVKELGKAKTPMYGVIGHYMDILYKYGKECNSIAELGVQAVISSWAWAKSKPKKIILCDVEFSNLPRLDSYINLCKQEKIEVIVEKKSSLDIIINNIDLLFIDSNHAYEHVLSELNLHSKHINKYIIMHDTNPEDIYAYKGPSKARNEFLLKNQEWVITEEIKDYPGLTILKRIK